MTSGTGLDSQLGTETETTVGTEETVTSFFAFNSAGLTFDPSYVESSGIQAGVRFKGISQTGLARQSCSGKLELPMMMKSMGWWMKHLIGSTADPAVDGTLAYKQIHIPAGMYGKSFTTQIGKPQPSDGVVKPLTYRGCKVTDWDLTFADNEITMLSMSLDAWAENTATTLATASYASSNLAWNFSHVNVFETGGTVGYAGGEMTYTSGTTVPSVVTKFTLSGKNTFATDRYGLGNAGIKKEQLETDFCELTGSFEGEYDQTTWGTPLAAGDTVTLHIASEGPEIETSHPYLLDIIIPAAKITSAPAELAGPGIVSVRGEFKIYDPETTDQSAVQIKLVSTDSAAW